MSSQRITINNVETLERRYTTPNMNKNQATDETVSGKRIKQFDLTTPIDFEIALKGKISESRNIYE